MDSTLDLIWLLVLFTAMHIQSPAFGQEMYGEFPLKKHWYKEVPQGYQIQLHFNYFNIMPSEDCRNDSLRILHNKAVKYCGEKNLEDSFHPDNSSVFIPAGNVQLLLLTNDVNQDLYAPVNLDVFYQLADIDECSLGSEAPLCSQICLNTVGSYVCACHHGFMLDSDNQTCIEVECESPNNVNGRIIPALPKYNYKDVITVHCDTGYRIIANGKEVISYNFTCLSNGRWSLNLPKCHIIHCDDLPPLSNGKMLSITGLHNQYQSVIKLQCDEIYAFSDKHNDYSITYTCNEDKKWKDDQKKVLSVLPKCLPVCGRPSVGLVRQKRLLGGQRAPQRTFPWHVFIHKPVRGGGAVIAEQWILTSASNLVINNQPFAPDSVKIYVGGNDAVTFVSGMSPLKISSLHIHPMYNNRDDENFNHDIAMIKLKNPIQYSADVMPVCLPLQDTEYSPGLNGLVSGFGQTARTIVSRFLRYTFLPVVDQNICHAFIDKLNIPVALTDNMFCAGVPEGGKDACSGDSGGAFVLKEGGVFRAAGLVSWGHECGKPGRYGVYTKVANYVEWINKTMSEN